MPESPPLSPLGISEDLVPLRENKQAGETQISFDGLLDPPLRLHEDLKEGCGGQLWPAGMVLAKYLLERLDDIRGKTILELGAGGGLVGLALALALRQTASLATPPILITDLPILLPLQEKNVSLNSLTSTSIISASLPWGSNFPDASIPECYKAPDIILAADCVYYEPAFPLLMETLRLLMYGDENEVEEGAKKETICYFCMKKRRKADMRFISSVKKEFIVEEVEFDMGEMGKGVFLYKVRRKSIR